jgi:putative effector of murein hydrolase LrgA (UPF0299 family)
MDQSTQFGGGIVLMLLGTIGIFAPIFQLGLPRAVLGAAVLILALGTLMVGISSIAEGEYSV